VRRPRSRADGGQGSVELALLLPVVLLLLLAVLQVGLLARDVVLVTAAVAASGLDPARLSVTSSVTDEATIGRRVRVEVAYRAPTAVPLVGALLADRTLRAAATMRVEMPPPEGSRPAMGG
jgi:hypothetical protein